MTNKDTVSLSDQERLTEMMEAESKPRLNVPNPDDYQDDNMFTKQENAYKALITQVRLEMIESKRQDGLSTNGDYQTMNMLLQSFDEGITKQAELRQRSEGARSQEELIELMVGVLRQNKAEISKGPIEDVSADIDIDMDVPDFALTEKPEELQIEDFVDTELIKKDD